jgi:hypothetical protein
MINGSHPERTRGSSGTRFPSGARTCRSRSTGKLFGTEAPHVLGVRVETGGRARHAHFNAAALYQATVAPDAILAYLERRDEGWTVVVDPAARLGRYPPMPIPVRRPILKRVDQPLPRVASTVTRHEPLPTIRRPSSPELHGKASQRAITRLLSPPSSSMPAFHTALLGNRLACECCRPWRGD